MVIEDGDIPYVPNGLLRNKYVINPTACVAPFVTSIEMVCGSGRSPEKGVNGS